MSRILVTTVLLGTVCAITTSCGSKKGDAPKATDDAPVGPSVPPIAMPTLGVASLPPWGFTFNAGKKEYEAAQAAYKAKPRDWAGVRAHCEQAIGKDIEHYDAHRLLAAALAQTGAPAAASEQLAIVLAADYFEYGPELAADPDLKDFLATPHGVAVTQLAQAIAAEYARRIATGVWLVGRRSTFKWPKDSGPQGASSRGELYAFDRETRRYLRLTHTGHQVVGFARNAAATEVAIVGFDKIEKPVEPDVPPVMARAWVQVLDGKTWIAPKKRTTIAGPIRELAIGYAAGDVLIVSTAPAQGRWGLGAATVQALDAAGKLAPATVALPEIAIAFTLDESAVHRAAQPLTVAVPESGTAAPSTIAIAPDRAHTAFATAVDPCAKGTAPSLYVADAKGTLTHVLSARSRFATRWIDATTLAYEDGEGAIRLWDASTARETQKIVNPVGIALEVLSTAAAPLCKQLPPTIDAGSGSDAGSDDTMPPEE